MLWEAKIRFSLVAMSICACRCVAQVERQAPSTAVPLEVSGDSTGASGTSTVPVMTSVSADAATPGAPPSGAPGKEPPSPLHVWTWLWLDYSPHPNSRADSVDPFAEVNSLPARAGSSRYSPVYPFALRGATLATEGHSVAILRDNELQQDGLYSRRGPSQKPHFGPLRALAGVWPQKAYALYERHTEGEHFVNLQLLSWKAGAWKPLRTLRAKQALLAGNESGKAYLAESLEDKGMKSVALRQLDGPIYKLTPGGNGCTTRLVAPRRLEVNDSGDVLLRGEDCAQPNRAALELWRGPSTNGSLLAPELDVVLSSTLDAAGHVWIAGQRAGQSAMVIMRLDGEVWSVQGSLEADGVASMAVDATDTLWLLARHKGQSNELVRASPSGKATRVTLPPNVGSAQWLKMVHGKLWISAERALLSTELPANEWDWIDVGVPYPLSYAPRRALARRGTCPPGAFDGGNFVVVFDKAKVPDIEKWAKEFERTHKRLRLKSREIMDRSSGGQPAFALIAREGNEYFFGILVNNQSIVHSLVHPFPAHPGPPIAYCANPTSLSMRRIEQLLKIGTSGTNRTTLPP